MQLSIKERIYWSFFVLVLLFVLNGMASFVTLNNNRKLSEHISTITNPSIAGIENFKELLVQSKMYTMNCVFLQTYKDDKEALKRLHSTDYPLLKEKLNILSQKWSIKYMGDSLKKIYTGFENLLVIERTIMSSLQKFEDDNDHAAKLEAVRLIKDDVLPHTSLLINALSGIIKYQINIRNQKNKELNVSFMQLRMWISFLAVTIIFMGIFLSLHMARAIIRPINTIRHIVNDLGNGIIRKVNHTISKDEIGRMIRSVNDLSEKLHSTAAFATEIGNRNFDSHFEPLSEQDILGKALVAMRDNLKTSDESLNEAQHIAKLGSWELDLKTNKLFWSDEMFSIFDVDAKVFKPSYEKYFSFLTPAEREKTSSIYNKCLKDHHPFSYECKIISDKQVEKIICSQGKIAKNDKGELTKLIGISQDITERKRVEEKLSQERELFRLVTENIPDQIYVKDRDSRFLLCNIALARLAGRNSSSDMIGKTDFDFFPEDLAKTFFDEEQALMQTGVPLINHEEHLWNKVTKEPHWNLTTKLPLKNALGNTIGLIGINRDITERKIAEKKLEEINLELNILFNSIDEVFFSVNMITLQVIQISATCEKLYGYTQAEFMANYKLWFQIIHPEDLHIIEEEDEIMQRGELVNNQYRIIRKDNTIRWIETKITPTLDENGNLVRVDGVTRDVTERKKAEAELHKSEMRHRQIVETAQEGIWLIDENDVTTFVNKKMCEMLEYTQEEIIGRQNYYFKNAEEKKNAIEQIERRKQGISETHDSKFITKSGNILWTSVSTNPIFDDTSTYKGALAMFTDITKRKHDEELLLNSQAKLEQKNKELEQFAYVASHDLQEPLRTTISFVQIFKQQYFGKLDAKADKYLNYIIQASDRMSVLIKDLLDFSRIGNNKDLELVDCNSILRDVLADIDLAITDSNSVIISDKLPVISGYPTEIKQLFQNLTINAIKFRKPGITPQLKISAKKTGNYWNFSFADNGIGIDKEHDQRIFIIFQRLHTRSQYEGSGIGLSHCKKIVELHHGKIWVESVLHEGSIFHFTIPAN